MQEHPPPEPEAPSVKLLRAVGHEQRHYGYSAVEIGSVAVMADLTPDEMPALVAKGVQAGYIEDGEMGWVALSPRGWAWFEQHGGESPYD